MPINLYIKDMVNLGCKRPVKEELKKLGVAYVTVDLGLIGILGNNSKEKCT